MSPGMPRGERLGSKTCSEILESFPSVRPVENVPRMAHPTGIKWPESWQDRGQSQSEGTQEALKRRKMSASPRIDSGVNCGMEVFDERPEAPNGANNSNCSRRESANGTQGMESAGTRFSESRNGIENREKTSYEVFQLEWFDNERDAQRRTDEIMRCRARSSFHTLHSTATSNPHGGRRGSMASTTASSVNGSNLERNPSLLKRLRSFAGRVHHGGHRSGSSRSDDSKTATLQQAAGQTSRLTGQRCTDLSRTTNPGDHQTLSAIPRMCANRLSSMASSALSHFQRRQTHH